VNFDTRAAWGAKHGSGKLLTQPVALVVIHHSYAPDVPCGVTRQKEIDSVRSIERFHVEENNWAGIGYNWLVFQSGNIYEGRGWARAGAHTEGQNSRSVGICLVINGDKVPPTDAAIEAIKSIIATGLRSKHILPSYTIKGHKDFSPKSCPGVKVVPLFDKMRP
jgi:hypothetical protein